MWFLCKPSEKASRKGTAHTVCKSICSQIPNAFLVKLSSYPSLLSLRKNYETLSTHKPWHLEKSDETLFQGESNCTLTNQDGRTKCQPDKMATGQNANQRLAFCPHFLLWLAFCPSQFLVGILSGPSQHVLAFCQNHEKCRHLSECEWSFVRSVDFLPYR